MFPIGDDNTQRRSLPVVTYALIALNVLFFLVELFGGDAFVQRWAFVPLRFSMDPYGTIPTIFTAMFMHAGLLHLGGNMLYLWIFGDNIEDRLGPVGFLIFYLGCGIAATLAQYYVAPHSRIPNVGASGAIAGILGSYLLLFPHARVRVLLYTQIVSMPAIYVLGFWIALQLLAGAGSIFSTAQSEDTGGVAYMAHVGGFAAGFLITLILRGHGPRELP